MSSVFVLNMEAGYSSEISVSMYQIIRHHAIKDSIRLHNDELYDLYDLSTSTNSIREIKSRSIRWTRHVARMGAEEVYTGIL